MTLDEAFAIERDLWDDANVSAVCEELFASNHAMDLLAVTTVRMLGRLQLMAGEQPPEATVSPSLILLMAVAYQAGGRAACGSGANTTNIYEA